MAERRALPHIPSAELAAHALDGDRAAWDADAERHLSLCPTCRERLTAYARAAASGRLHRPGETLHEPPARVWATVRAHLDDDRRRTDPLLRPPPPSRPPSPLPPPSPPPPSVRSLRRACRHAGRWSFGAAKTVVLRLTRLRPGRRRKPSP
ncbi:hypothetical protein QFZ66_008095 [Streptomyces sp. B4I13]|uniref:hypothetical protein n=1 Tax=Streptomyces sp. B4I13 TaxID=3042271 RepID=UPI00277E6728|nr:hypothetical protein [Streptomyces sp. B4I13]MDQ0964217.1 hypothetical protein [Streptomyces sp. B4I13]